ncbi:taste receptor type 2 member 14 [Striga asiatica]|uniref:Taste receptor type 2 member 14 n=1 Tax=Striga asiatica TaxID=4170 RepID=A0A5A7QRG6_STRAF|nr:taste receptor type 2 member 14 [Striga asiatica]
MGPRKKAKGRVWSRKMGKERKKALLARSGKRAGTETSNGSSDRFCRRSFSFVVRSMSDRLPVFLTKSEDSLSRLYTLIGLAHKRKRPMAKGQREASHRDNSHMKERMLRLLLLYAVPASSAKARKEVARAKYSPPNSLPERDGFRHSKSNDSLDSRGTGRKREAHLKVESSREANTYPAIRARDSVYKKLAEL